MKQSGQVLTFFALALPVVLLPVAAYAVDATVIASREAGLQAATAEAAEAAAQQLDVTAIRSSGALSLNTAGTLVVVHQALTAEEPGANVDTSTISGAEVTIATSEQVTLPFSVYARTATLHARATARLVAGYDSPTQGSQYQRPVKANALRLVTVVVGLISVAVAFVDPIPLDIPAYAFGDASVLRAERGLAMLAILFVAFVVLWRGVAEGELPIEISREGFKYQQRQAARETEATVRGLERSVEEHYGSIKQLLSLLDRTVAVMESQAQRLAHLEDANLQVRPDDASPT